MSKITDHRGGKGNRCACDLWETDSPLNRLWLQNLCVPLADGWQGSYDGYRTRRAPSWCSHSGISSSSRGNEEHSSPSYDDLGSYHQSQNQEKEPQEMRPESEDIEDASYFRPAMAS